MNVSSAVVEKLPAALVFCPFNRIEVFPALDDHTLPPTLVALVPAEAGTIILTPDTCYHCAHPANFLIPQLFFSYTHLDWTLYKKILQQRLQKKIYKAPFAAADFALFPTQAAQDAVWLNPAFIRSLQTSEQTQQTEVQLTNGAVLRLDNEQRSLKNSSKKAFGAWAMLRHVLGKEPCSFSRSLQHYLCLQPTAFLTADLLKFDYPQWIFSAKEFFALYQYFAFEEKHLAYYGCLPFAAEEGGRYD